MDEPWKHYAKGKKSDKKKNIYCMISFIWNIQKLVKPWRQKVSCCLQGLRRSKKDGELLFKGFRVFFGGGDKNILELDRHVIVQPVKLWDDTEVFILKWLILLQL